MCGVVDVGSGSRCVGVGLAKVRERVVKTCVETVGHRRKRQLAEM